MPAENSKRYVILKKAIIDFIKKKKLKEGDKLPTVREIIKNYTFSYATVNRTLIELENEGVIKKHQGKGIYVNSVPVKKTFCAGLIIPTPVSEFKMFGNIVNGIKSVLEKERISLLISISNMSHRLERENIMQMMNSRVDGLIIYPEDFYRKNYEHIARLKEKNYPFVLIDRYIPELETDYVIVNNKDILYRICSYLKYKKNCERIFFVPDPGSTHEITATEEKIEGYRSAVSLLYGKEAPEIIEFRKLKTKLLQLSSQYSNFGLIFNHDGLVMDFIRETNKKKKAIPPNCHLFGYNNSHDPWQFPTVEQFNDRIGSMAASILIDKIRNPKQEIKQVKLDAKLILPDEKNNFKMEP